MLGSCFTTEIGAILNDYRFNVMANPFGTLYNPASILNSLQRLASCTLFVEDDVIHTNPTNPSADKRYASFYHHSSFARLSTEEFLKNANNHLVEAHSWLKKTDTIIITLGTAWVFIDNATGKIVSNCHKRVAKEFTRKLLSVEETHDGVLYTLVANQGQKTLVEEIWKTDLYSLAGIRVPDREKESYGDVTYTYSVKNGEVTSVTVKLTVTLFETAPYTPGYTPDEEDLRLELSLTAKVTLKQSGDGVTVPVYEETEA
jgi:hypothetical protein